MFLQLQGTTLFPWRPTCSSVFMFPTHSELHAEPGPLHTVTLQCRLIHSHTDRRGRNTSCDLPSGSVSRSRTLRQGAEDPTRNRPVTNQEPTSNRPVTDQEPTSNRPVLVGSCGNRVPSVRLIKQTGDLTLVAPLIKSLFSCLSVPVPN